MLNFILIISLKSFHEKYVIGGTYTYKNDFGQMPKDILVKLIVAVIQEWDSGICLNVVDC